MRPFKEQLLIPTRQSHHAFEIVGSFEPYWHYHPEIEITYVLNGNGTRCVGDHVGHFSSGDLVLLGQYVPHQWVCEKVGPEEHTKLIVTHIDQHIFDAFPECASLQSFFQSARKGIHFPNPTKNLHSKLLQIVTQEGINSIILLFEIVQLLADQKGFSFLASERYLHSGFFESSSDRMQKAHAFISQNYKRNIKQDEIAAHCNLSTTSFSRWFKKASGSNFVGYVSKMRISHAEQLLYMTNRPINEIAYQSGFESSSAFNRSFKQIKGVSPREFRKWQSDVKDYK